MTARKPIVLVGNATSDLAPTDTLDAVACFGYQPARPVTGFSTSNSGIGLAAGQSNASIGSVSFTATASNMLISASADVKSQGGATEFSMYLQLYNNTTGGVSANGAASGCYINTTASNGGNASVVLAATGLVVGQSYTVTLLGSATSVAVTVNQSAIGGVNL